MTKTRPITWGHPFSCQKGVSLIEVLVGLVLLSVICISSLGFFSYGMGGIGREGNRRAALERARERMEQLLAADATSLPPVSGASVKSWCSNGDPCTSWSTSSQTQPVTVNQLSTQPMETTAQPVHDTSAGTPSSFNDAWELGVKVWYTPGTGSDDNFNRVYLKTLRARKA